MAHGVLKIAGITAGVFCEPALLGEDARLSPTYMGGSFAVDCVMRWSFLGRR